MDFFLWGTVELIEFLLKEDAAVKKYFVIAHLRNIFCSKEEMSKFPTLCKIAMRILTMFGSTYSTAASLPFQI